MSAEARPSLVINAAVMATVSTVLPGFLIGAMSVQVSAEMGVSEGVYGWGLGSFFGAAMVGSIMLGRLAQRIGPLNQMTLALGVSVAVQLALAASARSFLAVIGFLVLAGLANAANQTSVNLALAQAQLPRLGLAVSIKQSGLPTATLLAGFAVPSLALTVGWRWAYVAGAVFALMSLVLVRTAVGSSVFRAPARVAEPESSSRDLFLGAVVGAFLAFSAGSLVAWGVGSGVDAGLGPGAAGLFLSVGAATGITMRVVSGWLSDTMRVKPFRVGGITALVGSIGMAGLALRSPATHVAAMLLSFGCGWIWPVFTNYGIVRTNPRAAGSATGITQMGVYVGVFVGPLVTGWLIEHSGYQAMWLAVAASSVAGAAVSIRIADRF
ncbi:MAG: MFS transporter [Acidimicrobiaceae bacterium]|nr:MFS transporter [Acidimicrobiaceae bacterium]MXZ97397.1 MFS transporter [Acidimicrobiaceae bacterium]MYF44600.1 MFS transporter [Acidimicrobiaceae bacterium]